MSMEADVFPLRAPERAIEIDGAIGDGSRFHEQFGYYAHGVGPETAHAPAGWEARAHKVALPPQGGWKTQAVAHYMWIDDVVLAKLVAGRPKDFEYVEAALRSELVEVENLRRGLEMMIEDDRKRAETNLEIIVARFP